MVLSLEQPGQRYFRRMVGSDVDQALAFFTGDYDFRAPLVRRTHENAHWDFAGVGDERMSLRSSRFMVDLRSESRSTTSSWSPGCGAARAGSPRAARRRAPGRGAGRAALRRAVRAAPPRHRPEPGAARPRLRPSRGRRRRLRLRADAPPDGRRHRAVAVGGADVLGHVARRRPVDEPDGAARHRRGLRDRGDPGVPAAQQVAGVGVRQRPGARPPAPGARVRARARARSDRHPGHRGGGGAQPARAAAVPPPAPRPDAGGTPARRATRRRPDRPGRQCRDETTVAEIARTWGFGHLGRFSATYRSRFGELPSESLRGH